MQNIQIISVFKHKATNITGISLSCFPVLAFNCRLFGFSTWWGGWIPCAKYIRSAKSPRRSIRGIDSWNQRFRTIQTVVAGGISEPSTTVRSFFFNENYEKRLMWRAKVLLERKKVNARVNKKTQEYLHDKFSQHSAGTHKYHQISQSMLKHFHGSAELTASSKMWPSNVPGSAKTEAYSPKCPEPPKGDSMVRRQFPTCFTYCKISLWYTYTLHITMTISYKWH